LLLLLIRQFVFGLGDFKPAITLQFHMTYTQIGTACFKRGRSKRVSSPSQIQGHVSELAAVCMMGVGHQLT
jgi:hypothetical protein